MPSFYKVGEKMFVIVAYDISSRKGQRMMKICRRYLHPVQKSVFEGTITKAKLKRLQDEIEKLIVPEKDKVCIYCLDSVKYASI